MCGKLIFCKKDILCNCMMYTNRSKVIWHRNPYTVVFEKFLHSDFYLIRDLPYKCLVMIILPLEKKEAEACCLLAVSSNYVATHMMHMTMVHDCCFMGDTIKLEHCLQQKSSQKSVLQFFAKNSKL